MVSRDGALVVRKRRLDTEAVQKQEKSVSGESAVGQCCRSAVLAPWWRS
jgi:hypothetical protein